MKFLFFGTILLIFGEIIGGAAGFFGGLLMAIGIFVELYSIYERRMKK